MMCVYGPAGSGKTMSVNSALRHLAPDITPTTWNCAPDPPPGTSGVASSGAGAAR